MLFRALLACLILGLTVPSLEAQEARVVVPDAPGGAFVSGCYRADRQLYGPYKLVFCVERNRRGTYSVQGPRLRCEGRLSWRSNDRAININLRRQTCNMGMAWAAARIECRPRSLLSVILDELLRDLGRDAGDRTRVVVPDRPTVGRLNCTYMPTVPGTKDRQFFANRSVFEPR